MAHLRVFYKNFRKSVLEIWSKFPVDILNKIADGMPAYIEIDCGPTRFLICGYNILSFH